MHIPRVFVGSSTEGLAITDAVVERLGKEVLVTPWTDPNLFLPGQFVFETHERLLRTHQFAVLVATADDRLEKRNQSYDVMRDNLLVEFGLFSGVLGRRRTYLVCPSEPKINLPTDLLGLMVATFETKGLAQSAPEHQASAIRDAVEAPCRRVLAGIRSELEQMESQERREQERILTSEKVRAIICLQGVVLAIRDGLMLVQQFESPAFLYDPDAFDAMKRDGGMKVHNLLDHYREDARLVGVEDKLDGLEAATIVALNKLPYPDLFALIPSQQDLVALVPGTGEVIGTAADLVKTWFNWKSERRDLSEEATKAVAEMFKQKTETYWNMVKAWRDEFVAPIQRATLEFHDALLDASINSGLRAE